MTDSETNETNETKGTQCPVQLEQGVHTECMFVRD